MRRERKTGDDAHDTAKATKRRMRVSSKITIIISLLVIVAAGTYIGVNSTLDARFMEKDPKAGYRNVEHTGQKTPENLDILIPGDGMFASEFRDTKRVNILLLGNTNEGLSDTIMLASFDPDVQQLDLISIPRDTYYERPGYAASFLKINAVFHEGPMATAEAVHEILLGIPINYYAVIEYDGIRNIVDAMDGVPMNVKQPMHYTARDIRIDIDPGEQVLDGEHAVQFLRFRMGYASGDVGRVEAQQQFLKNAAKKALDSNIPKTASTIIDNVDSDINLRAMLYISSKVSGMSESNIKSFILPGTYDNKGGLSFWVRKPDSDIAALLRQVYGGESAASGFSIQESSYYHEQGQIED
ncbi:MAG: LCP family protein [Clostridiales Family XIII bacterium]|jgi:LCP family protein required for cell wall assembly|nr:LCP family protein [Clostridiales Family XIII bacterium]